MNKAANLAIQARISLEVQLDFIRNGVRKEAAVAETSSTFEIQDKWLSKGHTKVSKIEGEEPHWYSHYGCQAKSKAKWRRSGKAARRAAARS